MEPLLLRPAGEIPSEDLLELAAEVRRAISERGETLAPSWPDELVGDLRAGRVLGWTLLQGSTLSGIAVGSPRGGRAFGHVHVRPGSDALGRAETLTRALVSGAPSAIGRMDLGATGLDPPTEAELAGRLALDPHFTILRRRSMVRSLEIDRPPPEPRLASGYRFVPARLFTAAEIAELDWAAFAGSPDQTLIADSPDGNRRLLSGILAGDLGRFLDEASAGVVNDEGERIGFVLTTEASPRQGNFVDLVVRPADRRHRLGSALLERGMRALLALGYERVQLWVTEANVPALRLYQSLGFEPDSTALIYRWLRVPAR